MTINYTLDKEDFFNFNMYYMKYAPSSRRTFERNRVLFPIIFAALGAVSLGVASTVVPTIIFVCFSIWWAICYGNIYYRNAEKRTRNYLKKNNAESFVGKYTITLGETAITCRKQKESELLDYATIQSPAYDPEKPYMYIFKNEHSAYTIPLSAFSNEKARREFNDMLMLKISEARRGQLKAQTPAE